MVSLDRNLQTLGLCGCGGMVGEGHVCSDPTDRSEGSKLAHVGLRVLQGLLGTLV